MATEVLYIGLAVSVKRRTTLKYYVGLDVSLKEISVCVIDGDGKIKARGTTPADPMAVKSWFKKRSLEPEYCS